MRHHSWAMAVVVALMLAAPGAAEATRCRDLDGDARSRCEAQVKAKCGSISGYWPKRRCEEQIAGGMDVCAKPANIKTCRALYSEARTICRTISQNVYSVGPEDWLAALQQYEGLMKRFKAFWPTMRSCRDGKFGCQGPSRCQCDVDHEYRNCRDARAESKKQWASFISYFHKNKLPMEWTYIRRTEKGKQYLGAAAKAKQTIARIKQMIALNRKAGLGADTSPLQAEIAKLEKKHAEMTAAREKQLARERCPTRKRGRGKLARLVKEHLSRHNTKVDIDLRRFAFNGRRTKTYRGVARNIVRQHQDSVACVRRTNEDGSKECYYIYAKLSRQKNVRERRWGPWVVERFHNTTFMLCKNLR